MNKRQKRFQILNPFSRRLFGNSPFRTLGGLFRVSAFALFLAISMIPDEASAISPAPFRKAISELSRSPAVRSAAKRLAKNPAGAAVVAVVAIGSWVVSLFSKKQKPEESLADSPMESATASSPDENPRPSGAIGTAVEFGHGSDVGVGVVAPDTASPGETVMVQVPVDSAADLGNAIEKAMKLDSSNKAVERGSLVIRNVPDGAALRFQLVMPKLSVDDPVQDHVWDGTPFSLQFFASVPGDAILGTIPAKLLVSADGRPVGRIGFVLNVVHTKPDGFHQAETMSHGYSQYFVSYSDKDFNQVLPRVQGMRLADRNVHFFFDKVSLAPGERYEPEIFDYIDNKADVFLLFWSTNSAASEWVEKEWRRALARQKEKDGLPDIVPVQLDRNAPPPPKELSHLHFGDGLMTLSSNRF